MNSASSPTQEMIQSVDTLQNIQSGNSGGWLKTITQVSIQKKKWSEKHWGVGRNHQHPQKMVYVKNWKKKLAFCRSIATFDPVGFDQKVLPWSQIRWSAAARAETTLSAHLFPEHRIRDLWLWCRCWGRTGNALFQVWRKCTKHCDADLEMGQVSVNPILIHPCAVLLGALSLAYRCSLFGNNHFMNQPVIIHPALTLSLSKINQKSPQRSTNLEVTRLRNQSLHSDGIYHPAK